MENKDFLNERKKLILFGAVENYIKTASPVTSAMVHEKYLSNISPATLRNELSTLEAMGYLKQLHTSSGRTPTSKAYRLYVNDLMQNNSFSKEQLEIVSNIFVKRSDSLIEIVNTIASAVSEATNYPSLIKINGFDKLVVDKITIVPLIDGNGLLLIATQTGVINSSIKFNTGVTEQNCLDASHLLTLKFKGKTVADMMVHIQNYQSELGTEIESFSSIFNGIVSCLVNLDQTINGKIYSRGLTKLLNSPEYSDTKEAKKVFEFIDSPEDIKQIFLDKSNEDISFTIGRENSHEALEKCTVIKANCNIGGNNVASIGIIGPERMDYSKIAASIKLIIDEINTLNQLENSEKEKEE